MICVSSRDEVLAGTEVVPNLFAEKMLWEGHGTTAFLIKVGGRAFQGKAVGNGGLMVG